MVDDTKSTNKTENNYYNYHIFNELYYLVDGGTIWTDSCDGVDNQLPSNNSSLTAITPNFDAPLSNSINRGNDSEKASITESNNFSMSKLIGIGLTSTNVELLTPLTEGKIFYF